MIMGPKANGSNIGVWSFPGIEFQNPSCSRHGDETLPRRRLCSDPLLRSAVILKRHALSRIGQRHNHMAISTARAADPLI